MDSRTVKSRFVTPGEAGVLLGIGADGVKYYDHELNPERTAGGRRLYLRERVEALAAELLARRARRGRP